MWGKFGDMEREIIIYSNPLRAVRVCLGSNTKALFPVPDVVQTFVADGDSSITRNLLLRENESMLLGRRMWVGSWKHYVICSLALQAGTTAIDCIGLTLQTTASQRPASSSFVATQ